MSAALRQTALLNALRASHDRQRARFVGSGSRNSPIDIESDGEQDCEQPVSPRALTDAPPVPTSPTILRSPCAGIPVGLVRAILDARTRRALSIKDERDEAAVVAACGAPMSPRPPTPAPVRAQPSPAPTEEYPANHDKSADAAPPSPVLDDVPNADTAAEFHDNEPEPEPQVYPAPDVALPEVEPELAPGVRRAWRLYAKTKPFPFQPVKVPPKKRGLPHGMVTRNKFRRVTRSHAK